MVIPDTNGAEVDVTVNNTLTRNLGSLKVTKSLTGGTFADSFDFTYSCVLDEEEPITGTLSAAAGGSDQRNGIPTGYVCTVTETLPGAPSGYTWSTPVYSNNQERTPSNTVEIVVNEIPGETKEEPAIIQTASVNVANQLNLIPPPPPSDGSGGLTIGKTLTGAPDGYDSPAFQIAYSCTNGGPSGTVSLKAGTSTTVTNIPNGSVCTVSENSLPEPPTGYEWSKPTITGSPTSPITASAGGNVIVANALNPLLLTPVLPATIPPATVPPLPATVPVPAKATIPTAVPAGGGYDGPRQQVPAVVLVLMMVGLVGAVGAATRRRMLREE